MVYDRDVGVGALPRVSIMERYCCCRWPSTTIRRMNTVYAVVDALIEDGRASVHPLPLLSYFLSFLLFATTSSYFQHETSLISKHQPHSSTTTSASLQSRGRMHTTQFRISAWKTFRSCLESGSTNICDNRDQESASWIGVMFSDDRRPKSKLLGTSDVSPSTGVRSK